MISYNIVLFHFTYFFSIYMYNEIYYNISYYISLHKIVFKILNCFHSIQFDKDYESFLLHFFAREIEVKTKISLQLKDILSF